MLTKQKAEFDFGLLVKEVVMIDKGYYDIAQKRITQAT